MVVRVSAAQPDSGPDLSGLQSSYTARLSRTLRWVMVGAFVLIAVSAVGRLLDHPDAWEVGLSVLQLGFYSLWLGGTFFFPPSVYLDADGLRFRKVLIRQRTIPWTRVREVQVQGRWQDTSTVVLEGGRTERLIGMPVDHARRLADALDAWSTS